MSTITASDAVLTLTIDGLFPAPVQVYAFEVDNAFETADIQPAETMMGVDGWYTGGRVPVPYDMSIHLMADSPSGTLFDQWYQAQQAAGDLYYGSANVILPAISTSYNFYKGILVGYVPHPPAKKVLQPRTFKVRFGTFALGPI